MCIFQNRSSKYFISLKDLIKSEKINMFKVKMKRKFERVVKNLNKNYLIECLIEIFQK